MSLKETKKISANRYELEILIDGEKFRQAIKDAYKQIESAAEAELVNMLPDDFKAEFVSVYNPDELTKKLIKAADKLSALIKCTEELNMGNREFAVAEKSTQKAVKEMNCPEADVFMEEFMPGFSLSLDEQGGNR